MNITNKKSVLKKDYNTSTRRKRFALSQTKKKFSFSKKTTFLM